jgi:hypothetical protein
MPGFRSLALISSLTSTGLWNKCIDDFLLIKLVESRLTGQARIQNAPARRLSQFRQSNASILDPQTYLYLRVLRLRQW